MADSSSAPLTDPLEPPRVYLVHMVVFTLVVAVLIAILLPNLMAAFKANVILNSVIVATLLLGMFHSYRMVARLFPEVKWVNRFRENEASAETMRQPVLLGPMSTMLRNRQRAVLTTHSMRSLLDSLASRLDEARDLSRYLVALLIFLGLLGTFWGLLSTVSSIGDAISALDVSSGQSASVFENLKNALKGPLAGMGLSFSSSMFGLAGSLILGFLDLKASQAQNRFYNDLEDWLSTITDIGGGDASHAQSLPQFLRGDVQALQRAVEKFTTAVESRPAALKGGPGDSQSMEQLAEAVAALVAQMREEQKTVRQWAQNQQLQQNEIQRLLLRIGGQPTTAGLRTRISEE